MKSMECIHNRLRTAGDHVFCCACGEKMFGLSTDTKPTEGLITGSKFIETDAGDVYLLEEGENAEWHKASEGPGSRGFTRGSSGIRTQARHNPLPIRNTALSTAVPHGVP